MTPHQAGGSAAGGPEPADPGAPELDGIDAPAPPPPRRSRRDPMPEPPPGYVWVYPPPPPDPPWHAPRWLKYVTAAWIIGLVVAAVAYSLHGSPTVREQTTVAQARPVVDTAVLNVVRAAGTDPVVAVSGFDSAGSCQITTVRAGADFQRTVDLYTATGAELPLLRKIAAGLPAGYHATVDPTAGLYADAGYFVAVTGTVPVPGEVEIKVVTGCRDPAGSDVPESDTTSGAPQLTPVDAVLARLRVRAGTPHVVADLACGDGQTLRAVRAVAGSGQIQGQLGTDLAGLAPDPRASGPDVYAYRDGAQDVVVRRLDSVVTVTVTSRCGT